MSSKSQMNIFDGLEQIVELDYPLARYVWYGIGGRCDYFIRPQSIEQLQLVIKRCRENDLPMHILGFGSNLLISDDGVKGAVIKLTGQQFRQVQYGTEQVTAWGAAEVNKLVFGCVKKGLSGIEGLAGIPGSVGASVKMNAGGGFGDIGSVVNSVTLMDRNGSVFEKAKPELAFDYRTSNISAPVILNAELRLDEADSEQIMKRVKEIWIYKKNSQPLNGGNCGCVFKNPRGVSAGALIDRVGLKGLRIGSAVVSEKHANFIIAQKGCKAHDVKRLMDAIKQRVKERFDTELEPEIEFWE